MNKNKHIVHDQKHLTLSDRTFIEQELCQGSTLKYIGDTLQKDPTTISKEIRKHRKEVPGKYYSGNCRTCKWWDDCTVKAGDPEVSSCDRDRYCTSMCRRCWKSHPEFFCTLYIPITCKTITKAPYVCNGCDQEKKCRITHYLYKASEAQKQYEKQLVKSREGINMTLEELQDLNELISPLVLKGQPLSHIFAVHADEIPVCRRTLYNYFDQSVFKARNIDLPRRVRYKKRKKRSEPRKKNIQQTYRNKRTYVDFEKYTAAFPELGVVEMDTVKGTRAVGKCLLTLLFRSCSFMLVILLPDCTQSSVVNAINNLCDTIGIRTFKKYFPIILTDYTEENTMPKFLLLA